MTGFAQNLQVSQPRYSVKNVPEICPRIQNTLLVQSKPHDHALPTLLLFEIILQFPKGLKIGGIGGWNQVVRQPR
jgi:hypothetical protein